MARPHALAVWLPLALAPLLLFPSPALAAKQGKRGKSPAAAKKPDPPPASPTPAAAPAPAPAAAAAPAASPAAPPAAAPPPAAEPTKQPPAEVAPAPPAVSVAPAAVASQPLTGPPAPTVAEATAAASSDPPPASGLRARLHIDPRIELSFDSNIGQSDDCQTIGGKSTCGAASGQSARLAALSLARTLGENPALGPAVYQRTIGNDFAQAAGSPRQLGLPLQLGLAVEGRPLTLAGIELWVGYRFSQRILLYAQSDSSGLLPDAETYHRQEHAATVRLASQLRPWLHLGLRLSGFVNFSGLSQFTPFQAGLYATAYGVVVESERWRTLASLSYQLRHSFDRAADGYLDGHRIQVAVAQEYRFRFIRPQLGYRFTYDATGVLSLNAPITVLYTAPNQPQQQPMALLLGSYSYVAPLSYQGHQLLASAHFQLPLQIEASGLFGYEYQRYVDSYSATYTGFAAGVIAALPPFALPAETRQDHRLTVGVAARRELPYRLAVELSYGFLANLSNIDNVVDNRTYTKHTIAAAVSYSF